MRKRAVVYDNRYCTHCRTTQRMKREVGYMEWTCLSCERLHKHEWERQEGQYLQADLLRSQHLVRRVEDEKG